MRLLGRFLLALGVVCGGAGVAVVGCIDQEKHLPGLPNMLPNRPGGAGIVGGAIPDGGGLGGAGGGSSVSAGGAGGSTSTGVTGPAQSICDVAAAENVNGSTCATCVNQVASQADPQGCLTEHMDCTSNALCLAAIQCTAMSCKAGATYDTCILGCVDISKLYQTLLTCEKATCGSVCGVASPIPCVVTDGG